ncbi:hypothetical protein AB0I60_35690 [Actinosynnema sp. NPDC050436]|uniref:hypothetical protein n=1 Tax=Actinosynnema sp. NPDC050436 TaxID=3155659 RepID=UPI00340162E5
MTDVDAKLTEELRLLLDAAADRAQPWLNRLADGAHDERSCGWCPLCNAAALVRGDRSELAARAAEHVTGLVAVLRAALSDPAAPAPGPGTGPTAASPADPAAAPATDDVEDVPEPGVRVQHIPVVRRRTQC